MPITLKDIAEQTGVSPSVVSTVLSGRDNGTFVSESTRLKVLQVAERLHYTPVRAGRPRGSRRLRRQREERFVGVWAGPLSPSTAFVLQALQGALFDLAPENGLEEGDDFGLRLLSESDLPRLDAIGLMGMVLLSSAPLPREAAAATLPCVLLGETDQPARDVVQVHADNFAAGETLAAHLWELGHRRMAFVALQSERRVTRLRYQGMQAAWAARGSDPAYVLPAPCDGVQNVSHAEGVRRAVLNLFAPEAARDLSALVCADEGIAAVARQTLAELGRRVPEDVSLAAFGDTPFLAEAMTPPLTVMRPPLSGIAEAAVSRLFLLHDALLGEGSVPTDDERDLSLLAELVVRASTSAPPAV